MECIRLYQISHQSIIIQNTITQGLLCTTTSEGQDTDSSNLGVMAAGFYFMPFVITVLTVVGVPVINTIAVQG